MIRSEREKMLAGELYDPLDPELSEARLRARVLTWELNATGPTETQRREELMRELLGSLGGGLWIEPPFYCDYGVNIQFGEKVFLNFNCVILDITPVKIGDRTLLGPAVQIYAACHPLSAEIRAKGLELGKPVTIGSDVWIGGGAVICPGVTIGDGSVIGAGSVVPHDIPAGVVAVGNPAHVLRSL
jgi:maltose O-acetyltransferase